jgi:hypothetical protein
MAGEPSATQNRALLRKRILAQVSECGDVAEIPGQRPRDAVFDVHAPLRASVVVVEALL